jgi:serine/threonine-protein kinase
MASDLTGVVLKEKWRIDALLGEGGVAAVYSATHRNGKRVAVKVLHPHLASVPDIRDRFLREGYVANHVDHPGCVSVLDDDSTADGRTFLVMDLLDGESLEKRLAREGRLRVKDVIAITDALLDVLCAAHAKGIVHRDIKPENIFLIRGGGQRLLDFGIARLHEQASAKNATQSGAAMGTPSYMPPEQARGRWEQVDGRSDLWAVGATMFALLTGRCVHEADTINETLLLAMSRPAPPLASVWSEAPPSLALVVDRALAFEVGDRWSDAPSMRAALETARLEIEASSSRGSFASLPGAPKSTLLMPHATPSRAGVPAPPHPSQPRISEPRLPNNGPGPRGTVLATVQPTRTTLAGPGVPRALVAVIAVGGLLAITAVLVLLTRSSAPVTSTAGSTLSSAASAPAPGTSQAPSAASAVAEPAVGDPTVTAPLPTGSSSAAPAIANPAPVALPAPEPPRPSPTAPLLHPPTQSAPPPHPASHTPGNPSNPLDRRH